MTHPESDNFIHEIHKEYLKMREAPYINYCLDRIREFEKRDVALYKMEIAATDDMSYPNKQEAQQGRKDRLSKSRIVEHKSCVEWREHTYFIEQKTYSIHRGDNPPNSIIFFCQEDGRPKAIDQAFKMRVDNIRGTCEFVRERNFVREMTKQPDSINFECECDLTSQMCSIRFTDQRNVPFIPFLTLYELLSDLVSALYYIEQTNIHISFFDFTCDDLFFPGVFNERIGSYKPVFISSNERDKTLVYGTNNEQQTTRINYETTTGIFQYAHKGSPSPQPKSSTLRLRPHEFDSGIRPGGAAVTAHSESPAVPPSPTLTVHLSPEVISFVDFVPKCTVSARSVSPDSKRTRKYEHVTPLDVDGGSHRTHTHTRRISLRHPRVGKKVSLRHGNRYRPGHRHRHRHRHRVHGRSRRHRDTKVRSTRSIRKRKTRQHAL